MSIPNPDYDAPVTEGFTGTVQGFLAWLNLTLAYGGALISDPEPHPHIPGKKMLIIKLITGGYSRDEALIGRIARFGGGSLFALAFWESTHRGGLEVFHISEDDFNSTKEQTWLEPATDVFEEVHRARTLIVHSIDADTPLIFSFPEGIELSYNEPARSFNAPNGTVIARHLAPLDLTPGK